MSEEPKLLLITYDDLFSLYFSKEAKYAVK